MRLYLYRLSLSERGGPTMFDDVDARFERPSRLDFLRKRFAENAWEFEGHGGAMLRYDIAQVDSDVVSAVVAKWVQEERPADPSDIWTNKQQNHWKKAAFFLNMAHKEQVVGLEYNRNVGKPSSVLKHMVTNLNRIDDPSGYKIDVFPIVPKKDFMEAIEGYAGPITSVAFDLVIPNPTDASGATARALRGLRRRLNANRYRGEPSNKDGLDLTDPMVKDMADYAARGGGDVKAKSDSEVVYDSREHVATVEVEEEYRPTGEEVEGLFKKMFDKLKR